MAELPDAAMKRAIAFVLRVVIASVFIWAGAAKAWNPGRFSLDILEYRLVGQVLAAALALYLPWLELISGAALLLDRTWRAAAMVLLILLAIFSAAVISALARGLQMTCGCFGEDGNGTSLGSALLRNALIFVGLLAAIFLQPRSMHRPAGRKC